jgi:hypothetical protein
MKRITVLFLMLIIAVTVHASEKKNVYILVDLSDSSPNPRIPQLARKTAIYVDSYLSELCLGSTLHFITFGEYDIIKNSVSISRIIRNRKGHQLKDVRLIMKKIISNLPTLVQKEKLRIQKKTSIIATLKTLRQRLDLNQNNTIILLSDMLEYSHEANAYQLIKHKNSHLSKPKPGFLNRVDMYALGAGIGVKNSYENERLEELWREYFTKAGVSRFVYLTDF